MSYLFGNWCSPARRVLAALPHPLRVTCATLLAKVLEARSRGWPCWSARSSASLDTDAVEAPFIRVPDMIGEKSDDAAQHLEVTFSSFTAFPCELWRQILVGTIRKNGWTRIRRRTDVVGIFLNRAPIIRLVGAIWPEQARRMGRRTPQRGPAPTPRSPPHLGPQRFARDSTSQHADPAEIAA